MILKTHKSKIIRATIMVVLGVSICLFLFIFLPKTFSKNSNNINQLKDQCNISSELENLTKTVGDEFNFVNEYGIKIELGNNCCNPVFACDNVNLASVNFLTSDVECLQEGKVILYVKVGIKDSNEQAVKGFTLNIENKKTYPTSVSFTHQNISLSNENLSAQNALILDETTEEPEISYQNNFVEYDYQTGLVRIKENIQISQNVTDKVTLKIPKNSTEYFEISFNVNILCTSVNEINGGIVNILLNKSKVIRFDNLLGSDDALNSFTKISILNTNIAQITYTDLGYVIIKGLSVGTTKIEISNDIKLIYFDINVT